jgi:hypothetical protein
MAAATTAAAVTGLISPMPMVAVMPVRRSQVNADPPPPPAWG